MERKKSRVSRCVEFLYVLNKASILFWFTLIKTGFFYSWTRVIAQTLLFLNSKNAYYESYRKVGQSGASYTLVHERVLSLVTTFSFLLFCSGWIQLLYQATSMGKIMFITGIINFSILIVFQMIYAYSKETNTQTKLNHIFLLINKNWAYIVFLTLGLCLLIWITLTQFLLGILLFPGIFLWGGSKLIIFLE